MNDLELRLKSLDTNLFSKFEETKDIVKLLLGKYSSNFPTYTDHSDAHTLEVFTIAADILTEDEINNLNADEIYILSMSCLLHDIGMCVPIEKIKEISGTEDFIQYKKNNPNMKDEDYVRNIHHLLSEKFILEEWENLKIPSENYAVAIGRVSAGHRKIDIGDFDVYDPRFFAKTGKVFVCLPYLAAILRVADELDVTNSRTPKLLTKYYMPNNDISISEWKKHIATSQRNYLDGTVIFEVTCTDQNIYAALQEQFEKIQHVINYCQKVIRSVPFNKNHTYSLELGKVIPKYKFQGFDPKGIRFSFDVQNVITAFIGEDLYKDRFTALREAVQNSIDSCRYKLKVLKEDYAPKIKITITKEAIEVSDNGAGMDEFIIENFFGKLACSFYEQEKIKNQFEAIGQFGVGVFSYFLLGEYIDIETKTKNGETLKFRFDKDPKSYFHFFDKTTRTSAGTTLTITLNELVKKDITYEIIEKYIRKIFKHIEIPLEITFEEVKSVVEFQDFTIDQHKEIHERIKLRHQKNNSNIQIITAVIDNDEFEGISGIFVGIDYLKTFSFSHYFDYEQFRNIDNNHTHSQFSISQKGVLVNNYSSEIIDFVLGSINIKKKVKINIDRNKFSDERQIDKICNEFAFIALKKAFELIQPKFKNDEERLIVSKSFQENYINYYPLKENISKENYDFLINSLYVKIYNKTQKIVSYNFFENINEKIILVNDESAIHELKSNFSLIIIDNLNIRQRAISKNLLQHLLGFKCSIHCEGDKGYYVFEKTEDNNKKQIKKFTNLLEYRYFEICESNSNKFLLTTANNQEDIGRYQMDFTINFNHSFIQFIVKNNEQINESTEYKKILKESLDYIIGLIHGTSKINEAKLIPLNEILEPLNKIDKIKNFTCDDFLNFQIEL